MDPNLPNPTDSNPRSAGPGSVDGFMTSTPSSVPPAGGNPIPTPSPANLGDNIGTRAETSQQLLNTMPGKAPKGASGSKAITLLFIVLFLLAACGAGYLYWQYTSVKQDLADEQSASQSLTTQLDDTQSSAAEQAADLQTATDFITELSTVAQQLKTQCGTGCNSITIPTLEDTTTE